MLFLPTVVSGALFFLGALMPRPSTVLPWRMANRQQLSEIFALYYTGRKATGVLSPLFGLYRAEFVDTLPNMGLSGNDNVMTHYHVGKSNARYTVCSHTC